MKQKKRTDCYLCGFGFGKTGNHPLSKTKDHVIPRSRGGTNEASNIQYAHQCCNYVKGSSYLCGKIFEQCREVAIRNGAGPKRDLTKKVAMEPLKEHESNL
jgi:hypothetical protein